MEVGEISAVLKHWHTDRQAEERINTVTEAEWHLLNIWTDTLCTYTASLCHLALYLFPCSLYISPYLDPSACYCFCQSVLSFYFVHSLTCPVFVFMDSTVFMDASWCFSAFCITPFSFRMWLNVSLQKWFLTNKQSHLNTHSQSESVQWAA